MSKDLFITFNNLESLLDELTHKYSKKGLEYKSKSRYPSTIIFFDSKIAYANFLKKSSFEKKYLSEIVPKGKDKLNCNVVKRWIDEIVNESLNQPLIILPITEYIRLCKIINDRILDEVFTRFLQTENASLIIPMLDYSSNYEYFFKMFSHRERMAEVYYLKEKTINDSKIIELILDLSSLIPEDSMLQVKDVKSWIQLWESGNFDTNKKILVRNQALISAISKAEIAVPKMDKLFIKDKWDLLSKWYKIDKSVVKIEPDDKVWDYIFAKFSCLKNKPKNWEEIVHSALGDTASFEHLYSELWEKSLSEKKIIARWFWLNEAKKRKFSSQFIQEVVEDTNNPEMLIDIAWKKYLENPTAHTVNNDKLNERKEFLNSLKQPLFYLGYKELKSIFSLFAANNNVEDKYLYITGIFDFEKEYLIQYLIENLMTAEKIRYPQIHSKIKNIWLPLSYYLEKPLNHLSDAFPSIVEDFVSFSETYMNEYVISKFIFDDSTKKLKDMHNEYINHFISVIAKKNNRDIPSLEDPHFLDIIKSEEFIFIDGVGFEWLHTIIMLFKERNWQVLNNDLRIANLPTDTNHTQVNSEYLEKFRSFDELLHKPYTHPETIYKELKCIQEIVEEIHNSYRTREKPIFIVSDHGSTFLSRKGTSIRLEGILPSHGGRYAYYSNPDIEKKEYTYLTSDKNGKIIIPLSYFNFENQNPKGESHGGGTIEEILAFSVKLAPPQCDIFKENDITVKSRKIKYSSFDKDIEFYIANFSFEQIKEVMISINHKPSRKISLDSRSAANITISILKLREYGLVVGKNVIEFTINSLYKSEIAFEFMSSSERTDFDKEFDF